MLSLKCVDDDTPGNERGGAKRKPAQAYKTRGRGAPETSGM